MNSRKFMIENLLSNGEEAEINSVEDMPPILSPQNLLPIQEFQFEPMQINVS
jgi:hypothetical protein